MNRVEKLREYVDEVLLNKNNDRDRRMAYVHLYGVAQACALIAKKRGVDIELAIMAGMLHDLYTYKRKDEVRHLGMDAIQEVIKNHRVEGPIYVREVLNNLSLTTVDETNLICTAIQGGYDGKDEKISEMEKVINDANIMQFYFYNPISPDMKLDNKRVDSLLSEFGVPLY